MDHLEEEDGTEELWKFKEIQDHEGPLLPSDPKYKGSKYNVKVAWENGEITWEPLSIISRSDPVTVAMYGSENGLLDLEGWKKFCRLAN